MKTFTATIGDWHFWEGTQFMASYEPAKELLAFKNIDDCINYLYSRHLNATGSTLWHEWKAR